MNINEKKILIIITIKKIHKVLKKNIKKRSKFYLIYIPTY